LRSICDRLGSLALVVTFRVTESLEKEVELFDGCGCLVAFTVVVPEVEEGERLGEIFAFGAGDDRG
jgi:hypothetical protein